MSPQGLKGCWAVTKPNLGPLICCTENPIYQQQFVVKASAAFIADAKQAVQAASAHGLELPKGSQGKVSKDRAREGDCGGWEQLTDIHLTDWW